MKELMIVALLSVGLLYAQNSRAADIDIGEVTGTADSTVKVPVVLSDSADLSLVTFQIQPESALGAPTAVAGPDQANFLPDDVFVDALSGNIYRVTAFVRSTPNIGNGAAINMQFDLTGLSPGTYPVTIINAELLTVTNTDATGALSDGSVTVKSGFGATGWMLLGE